MYVEDERIKEEEEEEKNVLKPNEKPKYYSVCGFRRNAFQFTISSENFVQF